MSHKLLLLFLTVLLSSTVSVFATGVTTPTTVSNTENSAGTLHSGNFEISLLYPNPASDYVNFDFTIADTDTKAEIVFHSLLGTEVGRYTLDANAQKLRIPVGQLKSGIYFYTVSVDNKNLETRKFVVKH